MVLRRSWHLLYVLVPLGLLAMGLRARAGVDYTPKLIRRPYVQLATPNSIFVVWRCNGRIEPTLRYGTAPDRLDRLVPLQDISLRHSPDHVGDNRWPRLHSAPAETYQYEVQINRLEPDRRYYYSVSDADRWLAGGEGFYFSTNPEPGSAKPFRFWVVGDSGTGKENQAQVMASMQGYTAVQKHPIDLFLHVGDMAYSDGNDRQFQTNFFNAYEPTLRNTVCWPSMGNHEGHTSKGDSGRGPYFDAYVCPTKGEAGGLPSGTEAYYSFDYGHAHFICLDSHDLDRRPTGAMARWLRDDLDRTKASWLMAFWHHPPYTKGSHDSDRESQLVEMRTHIMPMLESAGVDVVFTGHSHIYERSMLIDGAYGTPTVAENFVLDDGDGDPQGEGAYRKSAGLHPHEGTVQIVAGNGGADLGRIGTMPVMKRVIVEHGSVIVDVDEDTLAATMVAKNGETRDLFSIVKRGQVTPQRIANPRLLPKYVPLAKKTFKQAPMASHPPEGAIELVKMHEDWQFLTGGPPRGDWTVLDFDSEQWKVGPAGFGFGDDDDATVLLDMVHHYTTVYLRKDFDIDPKDTVEELGLMINYDDAFIAYLNGKEVLRVGVREGRGKDARGITAHEAAGYEYFAIPKIEGLLRHADNIIAIEGHNESLDSSDFSMDPFVVMTRPKQLVPEQE